ncbi:hypothetical protein SAY87_024605 [Trapa incisa]|uniref:Uncharacterized protein n=1 Tax=Trapa incisa TaxID=236973 RepID=A0AAN7GL40_9MYRT|nr:hypothetical protein SAY87_024605 [Trapa incisa]
MDNHPAVWWLDFSLYRFLSGPSSLQAISGQRVVCWLAGSAVKWKKEGISWALMSGGWAKIVQIKMDNRCISLTLPGKDPMLYLRWQWDLVGSQWIRPWRTDLRSDGWVLAALARAGSWIPGLKCSFLDKRIIVTNPLHSLTS